MSQSESSPRNTTATTTSLTTENTNVSGNTGLTLVGGGDVNLTNQTRTENNISTNLTSDNSQRDSNNVSNVNSGNTSNSYVTTDGGAIKAISDIGQLSISGAVGLSQSALNTVRASAQDANAFADNALRTTTQALLGLNSNFVNAVSTFEENSQTQLANTVTALNQIAREQNQSANQLVVQASADANAVAADTLTTVFKNLGYALAVTGIIYFLSKNGRAFA